MAKKTTAGKAAKATTKRSASKKGAIAKVTEELQDIKKDAKVEEKEARDSNILTIKEKVPIQKETEPEPEVAIPDDDAICPDNTIEENTEEEIDINVVPDKESDAVECKEESSESVAEAEVTEHEEIDAEFPVNPKDDTQNDGSVDSSESVEALHTETKKVEPEKKEGFIRKKLGDIRRMMNYYWNGSEIDN